MSKETKSTFFALIISVVFFCIEAYLFEITFKYVFISLLGGEANLIFFCHPARDMVFRITLFSLGAIMLFVNLRMLLNNRIHVPLVKATVILYTLFILALLFLRSRGTQGMNLNPFDIIEQISSAPEIVICNVIIFIPFGCAAFTVTRSGPKAMLSALVLIFGIETAQYVFSLGVFDILDIATNMAGFAIGYLFCRRMVDRGWSVRPLGKSRVRFVHERNLPDSCIK